MPPGCAQETWEAWGLFKAVCFGIARVLREGPWRLGWAGQALGWDLHSLPALSWQTEALLTICRCFDLCGRGEPV